MKNRSTLVLVLTIVTVLLLSSISLVAAQDEPIKIGLGLRPDRCRVPA